MDDSPLNQAHYRHRKAEASMRHLRYDEAIEHHHKAVELLDRAIERATSPKAAESIRLQREYHSKQQEIVGVRRDYERDAKRRQMEKLELAKKKEETSKQTTVTDASKDRVPSCLKTAVNKTMDDADSLLLFLIKKHSLNGPDSLENKEGDVACKEPKSDQTIIEELQTVNLQLRKFIALLCEQLEEVQSENQTLKSKLKATSTESEGNEPIANGIDASPSTSPQLNNRNVQLTVLTDSTGNELSPYVFSPCSDFSPEDTYCEIKELPPLEMPDFDFDLMMSQLKAKRESKDKENNIPKKDT